MLDPQQILLIGRMLMSGLLWAAIKQDAPSSLVGLVQDMNPVAVIRDGGLLVPAEYNQGYFWAFENADAFRDVLKLRARIQVRSRSQ